MAQRISMLTQIQTGLIQALALHFGVCLTQPGVRFWSVVQAGIMIGYLGKSQPLRLEHSSERQLVKHVRL